MALELTQKRMTERGSKVKLVVREAVGDFLHYWGIFMLMWDVFGELLLLGKPGCRRSLHFGWLRGTVKQIVPVILITYYPVCALSCFCFQPSYIIFWDDYTYSSFHSSTKWCPDFCWTPNWPTLKIQFGSSSKSWRKPSSDHPSLCYSLIPQKCPSHSNIWV